MSKSFGTAAALAVTGVLTAGGVLAGVPAQASTATTAPAASSAKVVAHTDVDGDGRLDTVSITPTRYRGAQGQTLTVRTARKATANVTYATPYLPTQIGSWFGAARIDGVKGNELVVHTGYGAHTAWYAVYSWRGGKLVAQRDPRTRSTEWDTDGAWSISEGYTVSTASGRRTLTARTYLRDETNPKYFRGEATTFTWRGGAWKRTGHSTVRVRETSPKIEQAYGWHVAGLPND